MIDKSCTEGLRLQPSKDGEREVNHDETAALDRSQDPCLLEVLAFPENMILQKF